MIRRNSKRVLSLMLSALLVLPLQLLPFGISAAAGYDEYICIGSSKIHFPAEGRSDAYYSYSSKYDTSVISTAESYNLCLANKGGKSVLTLNSLDAGFNRTSVGDDPDSSCALYLKPKDGSTLTVVLLGTNTLSRQSEDPDEAVYGLYCDGNMTLDGSGELRVTAGSAEVAANAYASCVGIYADNITVSGGTINATGHSARTLCAGIKADGILTVAGGSLTVLSGNCNYPSYGAFAGSSITVTGGTLLATCDSATGNGCALYSAGPLTVSGGTVTANSQQYGIATASPHSVTLTGGDVSATGATGAFGPNTVVFFGSKNWYKWWRGDSFATAPADAVFTNSSVSPLSISSSNKSISVKPLVTLSLGEAELPGRTQGYTDIPFTEAEVKNTASETVTIAQPTGNEHFTVSLVGNTSTDIAPNDSRTIRISPRESLTPGYYSDSFTIDTSLNSVSLHVSFTVSPMKVGISGDFSIFAGGSAVLTATPSGGQGTYSYLWSTGETTPSITVSPNSTTDYSVTVSDSDGKGKITADATVNVDAIVFNLKAIPQKIEFASKDLSALPPAQLIVIKNEGNSPVHLNNAAENGQYEVTGLWGTNEIPVGEARLLQVRPKAGFTEAQYAQNITITSSEGGEVVIPVSYIEREAYGNKQINSVNDFPQALIDGDKLTLESNLEDISDVIRLYLPAGSVATLDLNGKTISRNGQVLDIRGTGKLIIIDSIGTGCISGTSTEYLVREKTVDFFEEGSLELQGGTVSSYTGYAIFSNNGFITVNGGSVITEWGAAVAGGGTVNILGGTVQANRDSGVAIRASDEASVNIEGGVISSYNSSSDGTVTLTGSGSGTGPILTVNGGRIENLNTEGAAVILNSSSRDVEIHSGEITGDVLACIINNGSGNTRLFGGTLNNTRALSRPDDAYGVYGDGALGGKCYVSGDGVIIKAKTTPLLGAYEIDTRLNITASTDIAGNNASVIDKASLPGTSPDNYKYLSFDYKPDTAFPVWFSGTQITAANMSSVFGNGNVCYTPAEGSRAATLTLNDTVCALICYSSAQAVIRFKDEPLNLHISGENRLTAYDDRPSVDGKGILSDNQPLTITADSGASLNINVGSKYGNNVAGIDLGSGALTVKSGKVNITTALDAGVPAPAVNTGIIAGSVEFYGGSLLAKSEGKTVDGSVRVHPGESKIAAYLSSDPSSSYSSVSGSPFTADTDITASLTGSKELNLFETVPDDFYFSYSSYERCQSSASDPLPLFSTDMWEGCYQNKKTDIFVFSYDTDGIAFTGSPVCSGTSFIVDDWDAGTAYPDGSSLGGAHFTVRLRDGLTAGNYSTTVTLTSVDGTERTLLVSASVTECPVVSTLNTADNDNHSVSVNINNLSLLPADTKLDFLVFDKSAFPYTDESKALSSDISGTATSLLFTVPKTQYANVTKEYVVLVRDHERATDSGRRVIKEFSITFDGFPVVLPVQTIGYTVNTLGSVSPVTAGGSYAFSITVNEGYHIGDGFKVSANGTALVPVDGIYTLENISEAQRITVTGIEPHAFGTEYKHDSTSHWHECECGEKRDLNTHDLSEWVTKDEADFFNDRTETASCSVCGAALTRTVSGTAGYSALSGSAPFLFAIFSAIAALLHAIRAFTA